MLFTLEALEAKHGDALLLHYGASSDDPQLVLVDGGPTGVFKESLAPRLDEIREKRTPDAPLPVRLAMLSHIDDDHVHGLLDLTEHLLELRDDGEPLPYAIGGLWHNSFDDILKKAGSSATGASAAFDALSDASAASLGGAMGDGAMLAALGLDEPSALLAASVPQGRQLANNAKQLKIPVNKQFSGDLVSSPAKGVKKVKLPGGLELTVLGPNQERLDALKDDWKRKMKKKPGAKGAALQALAAEFIDESVYNLSSIVVLASFGGHTMLLTGDARGDDILSAARRGGLLKNGRMHVDVLKEPHHGSDRNVATEFFRAVTADHYVISANGKYGNPDSPMLKMLAEARADDGRPYTVHLTNRQARVDKLLAAERAAGMKFTVDVREDDSLSVRIELGESLTE
jgi:hypothetical protein